jgi:polysaccharide export outer membrane protein
MTHRLLYKFAFWFLGVAMISACTSSKEVYYLEGLSAGKYNESTDFQNPVIQIGDQLSIFVSSPNAELAALYNMPNSSSVQGVNNIQFQTAHPIIGYLVDANGEIVIPKIGSVKLAGLRHSEAKLVIEERISPYLKDPVVSIRCINFRVTVIGELAKPGTYYVPYHEINILQALGLAGDLTINGVRTDVLVIRQNEGVKETYHLDLTSKDVVNSPVYHMKSGDVIYVKPNKTKINTSSTFFQVWPTVTSAVTLLVLVLTNIRN